MRTEQPTFRIPPLDARPRFPETLAVSVPRGTKHAIQEQADAVGMSISEYFRLNLGRYTGVGIACDRPRTSPVERMRRFLTANPDVVEFLTPGAPGLTLLDMGLRIVAEELSPPAAAPAPGAYHHEAA